MTKLLATIADAFLTLFALVFPMLARARSNVAEEANPLGRWLGRGVLVMLCLSLLWLLNQSETLGLKYWVTGRLGEYWLPLFALCVYAMIWLGWWLHRELLREIEPIGSEFPDIDSAWNQARGPGEGQDLAAGHAPVPDLRLELGLGRSVVPGVRHALAGRASSQGPRRSDSCLGEPRRYLDHVRGGVVAGPAPTGTRGRGSAVRLE